MALNPTTIPNCTHWFDADDAASFVFSSGVSVSQWNDKSGGARHFTQATVAQQPQRSVAVRNGKAGLTFDGARYMTRSGSPGFTNVASTIFLVLAAGTHRQHAGYLAAMVASGNDYDQVNGFDLTMGDTTTTHYLNADRASAGGYMAGTPPTPFGVYSFTLAAGAITPYKDGVAGTAGGATTGGTPTGLCLGTRWLGAAADVSYGMRGDIYELLIYSRVLTTTERQQVEQYLKEKWVLPVAAVDTVTVTDTLGFDLTLNLADTVTTSDALTLTTFTSPLDISGVAFWLDASILTPGASYSGWTSRHNAGWAMGPIGSPTPVVTTAAAGKNGLPVMRYTANGGHIAGGVGIDQDFTVLMVVRLTGGANQRFIGKYGGNFLVGYHGGSEDVAYCEGWLDGDSTGVPATTNWKLYTLDGASASFQPLLYKDGVVIKGTGGGATGGWNNTFSLGGEGSYSGQASNGEVAEVVAYNRKLSTAERQTVEAYLRAKWITPGAALTLDLADTVTPTDGPLTFAHDQTVTWADTVTTTEELGIEVAITFADGVNVSDEIVAMGAFWEVLASDSVGVSDLLGIAVGEYIIPCRPNPIVGTFKAGESVAGTWFVCAKKGILGLGAYAPVLEVHNLAASPAGLRLGAVPPFTAMQPPTVIGAGLYLGGYAPGFSLKLTPPLGALTLRTRIPLNVGLEPPIYPAGLYLGGSEPKFAGREPPVVPAGLGLGGRVPAFKFSHRLPAPSAGLALGGGPPVQVEAILIIASEPHPIDLLPSPVSGQVLLSTGTPVALDLLSSTAQPVTLGDVDAVPADLNEVECV